MKRIHKSTKWISLILTIVVIVGMIAGINIEKEYDAIIAGFLNAEAYAAQQYFTPPITSTQEVSAGGKLCKEIIEEGAVLLKNDQLDNGENSLPLKKSNRRVNIFGYGATNEGWLQFGIGSGSTPPQASKSVNLLRAFDDSSYSYNEEIIDAYDSLNWTARINGNSKDTKKASVYNIYEASREWYESQSGLLERAKEFSDTAIFVISRVSGENTRTESTTKESVPAEQTLYTDGSTTGKRTTARTYLQTTEVEEGILDMLHENFKNVIVILNTTNAMFLDTMDDRVQSVIYAGITGECGAAAIPEILWGEVNPSGHLTHTFPMIPKADPAFANRNDYNAAVFQEGIYFGYKWYETADEAGFWSSDFAKENFGITSYEEAVYRPFGFGMSYTTFDWTLKSIKIDGQEKESGASLDKNSTVTVEVQVTNTGDVEGKEVVQLYYSAPYYDGEIEKAVTNLIDFEKTISLKPGESQTLTLTFVPYDMASFDTYDANKNGFCGYELDTGTYNFDLKTDAHTVKGEGLSFTLEVDSNIQYSTDPKTGTTVKPIFSGDDAYMQLSIDGNGFIGNNGEGVKYLSRADFAGTFALTKTSGAITAKSDIASNAESSAAKNYYDFTTLPTTGVESDLRLVTREDGSYATLADLQGKTSVTFKLNEDLICELGSNYDSEKWDLLLNQMTFEEMCNIIYFGGYGTKPAESIGKLQTLDLDGPAGFNVAYATSAASPDPNWTSYPSETMIGCTFSKRIAYNYGLSLGAESKGDTPVSSLYGPGANLHRSPFGSRNYEYFSEDRVVTGKLAANEILGAKTNGLYMLLKHFVCDEMGYNPRNTTTWLTEQSLREEYARPFEIAVKEGGANAIMTSFNDLGNIYVGHNYALCTTMLRDEWGFKGMVVTDYYINNGNMYASKCVYAGNDMMLNPSTSFNSGKRLNTSDPIDMNCARQSVKNILYTYASTYEFALNNEPLDPSYKVDLVIGANKTAESDIPQILTTLTIIIGAIMAALTLFQFIRPVDGSDSEIYMTETEEKIRKQISRYLPILLCVASIVLAWMAKNEVSNSFFVNFITGIFSDAKYAFTNFGFGVAMNVAIYVGIIWLVIATALFIFRQIKEPSFANVVLFISNLLTTFVIVMFLGVLFFALSTSFILKSVTDLLYMISVGVCAVTAFFMIFFKTIGITKA